MSLSVNSIPKIMRAVEWDDGINWAVSIGGFGGGRFGSWFPAVEVEENVATADLMELDLGCTSVKIPRGTTIADIRIQFADDVAQTVLMWLAQWINTKIAPHGRYAGILSSAARPMQVAYLNHQHRVLRTHSYKVIPEGALYFRGRSQPSFNPNEVTFIVVG